MLCLQGQDWPGVRQSLALRTTDRSLAQVDQAFDSGQIVRTWPQRGTLHVMAAQDAPWYLALTAQPLLSGQGKRSERLGLGEKEISTARSLVIEAIRGEFDGRISREQAGALWAEAGLPGGTTYYLLHHLCVEGTLVQGPVDASGVQLFVLVSEWIEEPRALAGEAAVLELVSRYLSSHGPASRRDIAWWSGLRLRQIDTAIEELAAEITAIDLDGERYWVANQTLERAESGALAKASRSLLALPGFDELILGYSSRHLTIPPDHLDALVPGNNGMFRRSIVAGGTAVGFWKAGRKPQVELFEDPTPAFERRLAGVLRRLPI